MSIRAPKIDTLKNNRQYSYVQNNGQKISTKGFLLIASDNTSSSSKAIANNVDIHVGYTVTKKIGNAVKRNKVKRRLRQVVREVIPTLGRSGCNYIFIARHHTFDRPYTSLIKDMQYALHTFNKDSSHDA